MSPHEKQVMAALGQIVDPDYDKDIVSLGFVKDLEVDGGHVSFTIELTTPGCPAKDRFREEAERFVGDLPWVEKVIIAMTAREQPRRRQRQAKPAGRGLERVHDLLCVASCKGGVGKSTVAVNLAFALSMEGKRVGIFDADIYGPSLPTMVRVPDAALQRGPDGMIVPVEHAGLKMMSFGWVNTDAPAIMRGPMVSAVIQQLATETAWGELDVLVIDLPPGTGDVQLTLAQVLPLSAAILVTTPQQLSVVDVVRGVQAFDQLKVPTIAAVENMSYFVCDNCDKRHRLFGEGGMQAVRERFGIPHAFELPLVPEISECSDAGTPYVTRKRGGDDVQVWLDLAATCAEELDNLRDAPPVPEVRHDPFLGIVVDAPGQDSKLIDPATLRRACACAECVHEMTGEQLLNPDDVPEDIQPLKIAPMGNYAVTVDWSDDHHSIYPYDRLLAM